MLEDKAKSFFASNPDAKGVCLTSDGTLFDLQNFRYADAHSQTLENREIQVFAKDENAIDEPIKRLFFEGSIWLLKLIVEEIIEAIEDKIEEVKAKKTAPKKSRTE
jgi:hypothetical protein